jgi:hypothetical protein
LFSSCTSASSSRETRRSRCHCKISGI